MSLTETIPRVLRSELTLRGWTLTQLGAKFDPPVSCDQATKWVKAAGRDLRRLSAVCDAMSLNLPSVIETAQQLTEGRTDDA